MIQELVYTSAARGLKPGSSGFCTVASTPGMALNLAQFLESLSGYRHLHTPGTTAAAANPVVHSYLRTRIGGKPFAVLSRICDAGLDYSERSNKLAHHLAMDTPSHPAGPAWLLEDGRLFLQEWSGEARRLPPRSLPSGQLPPQVCHAWQRLTGDAGWASALLDSLSRNRPIHVVVPVGTDVLLLVREAQSLLPEQERWQATFSTWYTKLPAGVECLWRFLFASTPEVAAARRARDAMFLDIANLPALADSPAVLAARTGKPWFPAILPLPTDEEFEFELPVAEASAEQALYPTLPSLMVAPTFQGHSLQNPRENRTSGIHKARYRELQEHPRSSNRQSWWIGVTTAILTLAVVGLAVWISLKIVPKVKHNASDSFASEPSKQANTNPLDGESRAPEAPEHEKPFLNNKPLTETGSANKEQPSPALLEHDHAEQQNTEHPKTALAVPLARELKPNDTLPSSIDPVVKEFDFLYTAFQNPESPSEGRLEVFAVQPNNPAEITAPESSAFALCKIRFQRIERKENEWSIHLTTDYISPSDSNKIGTLLLSGKEAIVKADEKWKKTSLLFQSGCDFEPIKDFVKPMLAHSAFFVKAKEQGQPDILIWLSPNSTQESLSIPVKKAGNANNYTAIAGPIDQQTYFVTLKLGHQVILDSREIKLASGANPACLRSDPLKCQLKNGATCGDVVFEVQFRQEVNNAFFLLEISCELLSPELEAVIDQLQSVLIEIEQTELYKIPAESELRKKDHKEDFVSSAREKIDALKDALSKCRANVLHAKVVDNCIEEYLPKAKTEADAIIESLHNQTSQLAQRRSGSPHLNAFNRVVSRLQNTESQNGDSDRKGLFDKLKFELNVLEDRICAAEKLKHESFSIELQWRGFDWNNVNFKKRIPLWEVESPPDGK